LLWDWAQPYLPGELHEVIPRGNYYVNALVTALVLLPVFRSIGLYREHHSLLNIREYEDLFKGWILTAGISLVALTLVERSFQSRGIFLLVWGILLLALFLFRFVVYRMGITFRRMGWRDRPVLVYGAGEVGRKLVERIQRSPKAGLDVRGFLDDAPSLKGQKILGVPVLGGYSDLADCIQVSGAEEVLVAMSRAPWNAVGAILQTCRKLDVEVRVVPTLFDIVLQQVEFTEMDGLPLIGMDAPRIPPGSAFLKRLFDLSVALVLLVLASPVMAAIAFAIQWVDGKPVLFRQKRIGMGGEPFEILKFRSMYVDAPKYAVTPGSGHDPRITPIGRILRRTSLDELPQLLNVLRGDMSLVGPRPEMAFIVDTYNDLQRQRLNAKPGITGLWQISPDRAQAIHENMDYDIYYIRNQSFLLDLAILAKTAVSVVKGDGAW
jgi:exopolysaccharide biosynthesis polyprenyl glycosylphosphotransferase